MDSASITHTIVSIVYYLLVIPMAIFSAFSLYIYMRYGQNRTFTTVTGLLYIIIFLFFVSSSYTILLQIK